MLRSEHDKFDVNQSLIQSSLYRTISNAVKNNKTISQIISSYDNSIDIYLIAITLYVDEKISYKNTTGKNDYLDLNHLTYLHGPLNKIVTDDSLLHKIMNKIFPDNILYTNGV